MLCAAFVVLAAACGGDKPKEPVTDEATIKKANDEYKKKQVAYADSVIRSVSPARDVVKRLGSKYDVGSMRLRDSVAALANSPANGCLARGREKDPYLGGGLTFWVNIGVAGSDVVRIQESKWTSQAGQLVDDCLNEAARKWKFDATFGKPAAYIVQVELR
jgi:hypothetical protein